MIGRFLWWLLHRIYPCGIDVPREWIDQMNAAADAETERLRAG